MEYTKYGRLKLTKEEIHMPKYHDSIIDELNKYSRYNRMTGCFDSKTEVLTLRGWKKYNELDYSDKIATLNKETKTIEYHNITRIISYTYQAKMLNLQTRQVDVCVTPDHNMYIAKKDGKGNKKFRFCKPQDIFNKKCCFKKDALWEGENPKFFIIPKF